jgi:uncharacterized membrane protein
MSEGIEPLKNKSEREFNKNLSVSLTRSELVLSPYPSIEDVQVYESLMPGFFAAHVKDVQERGNRRHYLELLGLIFAFILVLVGMTIAALALYLNHPVAASAIFGALAGLTAVFIFKANPTQKSKKSTKSD